MGDEDKIEKIKEAAKKAAKKTVNNPTSPIKNAQELQEEFEED